MEERASMMQAHAHTTTKKKEKKENSLLLSHARSPPAFPLFPRSPFPDRRELSTFRVLALEKTH